MLDKVYEPAKVEPKWVKIWRQERRRVERGHENDLPPYAIVIPPPNVTGALHIGHGLDETLQDVLIRYHRLLGQPTCWVPGTDHGGIATQAMMEKQLKTEKLTRHQLGREKFLERMHRWTADCKETILGQLARLGCSLDWEREAFTMDGPRSRAVFYAFDHLWKKGLIKRGERMVNWCVRCGTALSDIEVEYQQSKTKLWHIRYPDAQGGPGLVIATTRPETLLGDTAVAVHPEDIRYSALVGKSLRLPLMDRFIPVVADQAVDSGFGTGAVKVTPAHDPNDFEIALRHGLEAVKVIGPDGRMTQAAGRYSGLSREKCREQVLGDLAGSLVGAQDHLNSIAVCYRCGQIIEPLLSWQWFVRMRPLAESAIAALDSGRFRLYPESWTQPYRDWLCGIKDWCISRQIWWGHRIPVWYCLECNRGIIAGAEQGQGAAEELRLHQIADATGVVSREQPERCGSCGCVSFIQDPDVLDTWFSSALWPLSVFGWPDETADLKALYPTQTLVTGYEILYLWVARMQMMGLELRGEVPFHHALIHGIVRDKHGKKMSKSLGNVIDPLVMMDKYGTDAFRFSIIEQAHPGKDIPFSEESMVGPRNFSNKIWNTGRFVLMNLPPSIEPANWALSNLDRKDLELPDRWILAEYQRTLGETRALMDAYELAAAADSLYGFLWDKFCDWYVELAKIRLAGEEGKGKEIVRTILVQVLTGTVKMLHPIMPFIPEELYLSLKPYVGESAGCIADSGIPVLDRDWSDEESREKMGRLMGMTVGLRT